MLKYTNQEMTAAEFNGAFFSLDRPSAWTGIGDTPTREAVLAWLAEGNTPEPADQVENPRIAEIKAQLDSLDFKKIRPLAAGDTEYLALLQTQTVVLQDELKTLLYPPVAGDAE